MTKEVKEEKSSAVPEPTRRHIGSIVDYGEQRAMSLDYVSPENCFSLFLGERSPQDPNRLIVYRRISFRFDSDAAVAAKLFREANLAELPEEGQLVEGELTTITLKKDEKNGHVYRLITKSNRGEDRFDGDMPVSEEEIPLIAGLFEKAV